MLLDARGNFVPQSTSTIDRNGIGLPSTHADHGWRDMVVFGQLNRDAFAATLDFGLLQPGEYFALHYSTEVRIVSDNPYASPARAEVIENDVCLRQGIDVGANRQLRPGFATLEHADDAGMRDAGMHLVTQLLQFLSLIHI